MKLQTSLLLGLIFMWGVQAAQASGDPQHGKIVAYTCHGCHGIPHYKNAAPTYSVPKLGGQHAEYLLAALKEYATGDRVHPTMHAQSASQSEQDMADIAAYFQGTGVASSDVVGSVPEAVATCVACHGKNGVSAAGTPFPILAGQHADYIEQAIKDYKSGKRKNAVMSAQAAQIKDADIPAIAAFFARQKALCSTDEIRDNNGKCR